MKNSPPSTLFTPKVQSIAQFTPTSASSRSILCNFQQYLRELMHSVERRGKIREKRLYVRVGYLQQGFYRPVR